MRNKNQKRTSSKNGMLIVLDLTDVSPGVADVWISTGFLARIAQNSNADFITFGPDNKMDSHDHIKESVLLKKTILNLECKGIIHISANQIFLDEAILLNAIEGFWRSQADYFTQWEHSRLPVGVGVRVFSKNLILKGNWNGFEDLITGTINNPGQWRIIHESKQYCSYSESLYDSRLNEDEKLPVGFAFPGYKGYLKFSKENPNQKNLYTTINENHFCDERGMAAVFGFESGECANFPTYIMLDITNVCNSLCKHCPHSLPEFINNHQKSFISLDSLKLIVEEFSNYKVNFIRVTADGEPLLHPEIIPILETLAKSTDLTIGLTTNGSLLNPQMAKAIIKSNLAMIDISLDAANEESYGLIRKGLSFNKVHKNIDHLLEIRNTHNSNLKVFVSFVEQDVNIDEKNDFFDKWEQKVDQVLFRKMTSNVNMTEVIGKVEKSRTRWPCPHVFRRAIVNYNGMSKTCPIDWSNKTELGLVTEQSIHSLWHSDAYWKLRLQHLNHDYPPESLCCDCSDWKQTPWEKGYEKVIETVVIPSVGYAKETNPTFKKVNTNSPEEGF